jgi:hypothetical protein
VLENVKKIVIILLGAEEGVQRYSGFGNFFLFLNFQLKTNQKINQKLPTLESISKKNPPIKIIFISDFIFSAPLAAYRKLKLHCLPHHVFMCSSE